jgi:hypothetical protein
MKRDVNELKRPIYLLLLSPIDMDHGITLLQQIKITAE